MSDLPRTLLPALSSPPGDRLEIVPAWDAAVPYQSWRPQILVPAMFRPLMCRIIAIANQKGGAGKTTTTVELAAALAAMGWTVRVIDGDDQEAALSEWLLPQFPEGAVRRSLRSVFFDECSLFEATYPTLFQNIDIVPSGLDLKRVEYERPIGAEQALAAALAREVEEHGRPLYDVTLIDGAPSLGLVTVAALTAADKVMVPLSIGGLDLKAMAALDRTITSVQQKTNPKLDVGGVFLTAWDKSGFARELAAKVSEDYPEAPIFPIRRSVRAAEAPIVEKPVRVHAPESTVSSDYAQAAGILLPREVAA
jgi:chromosome partitioning protein